MSATYEDFEAIQDFLPEEEGESILIVRREGRLHPMPAESFEDDFEDDEFDDEIMGRLIVLNERIQMAGGARIWLLFFITCLGGCWGLWKYFAIGVSQWYLHVAFLSLVYLLYSIYLEIMEAKIFSTSLVEPLKEVTQSLKVSANAMLARLYREEELSYLANALKRYLALNSKF